jgi:hypothetical protein
MTKSGTHELGLFRLAVKFQARDKFGRFVRVRHTAQHKLMLQTTEIMRAQIGLSPSLLTKTK